MRRLIEHKVIQINTDLQDDSDGAPAVTLSAGVALDSKENRDPTELFRQAGIALYYCQGPRVKRLLFLA